MPWKGARGPGKISKGAQMIYRRIYLDIEDCINRFNTIYVVSHEDPNKYLSEKIQQQYMPSRFVFGKLKILKDALKKSCPGPSFREGFTQLIGCVNGLSLLYFTDLPISQVLEAFKTGAGSSYGITGMKATMNIVLLKGPLPRVSLEDGKTLKKMCKVPLTIENGTVVLLKDFEVAREGMPLTHAQYKSLKLLKIKMPRHGIRILGYWSRGTGFQYYKGENQTVDVLSNKGAVGQVDQHSQTIPKNSITAHQRPPLLQPITNNTAAPQQAQTIQTQMSTATPQLAHHMQPNNSTTVPQRSQTIQPQTNTTAPHWRQHVQTNSSHAAPQTILPKMSMAGTAPQRSQFMQPTNSTAEDFYFADDQDNW